MQPPHLSCPSSSSSAHASSYITHFIQSLLSSAGFSKSSSQAIQLLTEVFERYLLLLASTSKHHSNHVGRRLGTGYDVERSLNDLGTSTEELQRWFDEEGGDIAGKWLEVGKEEGLTDDLGLPNSIQLRERQCQGKVASSERGSLTLYYETVNAEQLADLEAIKLPAAEDEEEVAEEVEDGDDDEIMRVDELAITPPPPYTRGRESITSQDSSHRPPTYKRRRLSSTSIDYVPFFLPNFPSEGNEASQEADVEYMKEREARVRMGEEKKLLSNGGFNSGEQDTSREEREALAVATIEMENSAKRATEDNWHSAVEFASSTLATQQSIEDIPEAILVDDGDRTLPKMDQESSHRIFAHDYLALVSEANDAAPDFLTPAGSVNAHAFNQRRLIAGIVSDPNKYIPCDTIFAAIDVRPSSTPFQPGPSLLITPPTNTNPAPTFTPIRANGRGMISSTINSSLHPICRHRIPNNVLISSRALSGGSHSEVFRRVTRIHDPIPILDERHAERVFQGVQATKEQLSESNSYLREALDVLKYKRAEEVRQAINDGTLEEEQSQLSLNASRDKMRVKSGTLVQTWNWMNRDYTDPVLPGKKYASGMAGVVISEGDSSKSSSNNNNINNNGTSYDEVDRYRQRSESVHLS